MQEGTNKAFEERLASLWHSGSHDVAVAFLRRAIHLDMSLRDLAQALSFEHARDHLANIRLGDVLRRSQSVAAPQPAQAAATPGASAARSAPAKVKVRRKRRGSDEMAALRELVLERLRSAIGGTTTSHLCDVLRNGGHDVDALGINRILKQLEEQGYVTCLGGKPKGWRLKPSGRTAPEPMQIRKAKDTLEPPATGG